MTSAPSPVESRQPPSLSWALTPSLVWMGTFFVLPLLLVLAISFASRGTYGGVEWTFSLSNYAMLADVLYLKVYLRSIVLALLATLICLVLGFPLGYYMATLPPGRQRVWVLLVVIPFWTNFLVRTYAWMFILRGEGLLNTLLIQLGLLTTPLDILYTDTAVLIGLVYGYLPFMVLPVYAASVRLDRALVEAAWDLYAGRWQVFWRVIVPLTWPGVVAGAVLVFIPSMGAYLTPDLLGGARTMMVGNLIQHEYLVIRDWPFGSAISFALMMLVLVAMAISARSRALVRALGGRP